MKFWSFIHIKATRQKTIRQQEKSQQKETIVVIAFSDKPRVIFRPTFSQKNSTVIEARRNFFIVDKCIWAKIEQIMVLHSLELDLRIDFETDNFDFDLDFLPKHTLNEQVISNLG